MSSSLPGPEGPGGDAESVLGCFEAAPALLFAFAGTDHVLMAVNAEARTFMGDRPDVLGRPLREVVPEYAGQRLFEALDQVHATGAPVHAREWRVQVDHDGDGELEERFVDFVLSPCVGAGGEMHGVVGVAHDVTETVTARRAAEARVHAAHAHADAAEKRYQAARTSVEALQRALLPADLPVLPGIRLAARYLVADAGHTAGGDWFDALILDDGRLALVVGDVVGHGVRASVVMSQLRAVLLELLTSGAGLAQALTRLGRFVERVPGAYGTTVCVVLVDQADGRCEYATCGHPPPLVVPDGLAGDPDGRGSPRYLAATGGAPLGAGPPVLGRDVLRQGEALVLFTDGLVERADRPLPVGLAELEAVAADAAGYRALPLGAPTSLPERVCRLFVELLTRTGYTDDVTVLTAHRLRVGAQPLRVEVPAEPARLARIRTTLGGWLRGMEVDPDDQFGVELAVTEAASNAVEHAYQGRRPGPVRVTGLLGADGRLEVCIADEGCWPDAAPAGAGDRGRGLAMIEHVSESMVLDRSAAGTTLTLRRRLRHPAVLASTGYGSSPARPPAPEFAVEVTGPGELRVRGPVDLATAATFKARLWQAWGGGAQPVTVDLNEVTQLASAGVAVLHQALRGAEGGEPIVLRARPGSAARYVLDLVGLPTD